MPLRHLPVLDGLRAVAILLVLWCHIPVGTANYPEWLKVAHGVIGPGGLGVDIFFVLSGFLITRILLREKEQGAPVRWFLLRRVLRIFPIYYLLLLVMAIAKPSIELAWCAAYLSNLHWILEPKLVRSMGHTWSLCVEEHFYLLWPLVVAFTPRLVSKWSIVLVLAPVALLCAYWMNLHYASLGAPPSEAMEAVQHASPVRFLSLGCGALLAYVEPAIVASPRRFVLLALALLVPALWLHPIVHYLLLPQWLASTPTIPWQHIPSAWIVHSSCLCTAILLFCLTLGDLRWSPLRVLHSRILRGIGRISYGLYLYHLPINGLWFYGNLTWVNAGLALATTFAVATVSYFVLERPILRFGARLGKKPQSETVTTTT